MKRSYRNFQQRLSVSGLRAEIEKRALAAHVSLQDLYEGRRTPSVMVARRAVYGWLFTKKKLTLNEIARLFDRYPNGIWKLVGR